MSVEKDGFSWSESGFHMATVSASGDARFDLKLTPLANLHGRVVDPEGKPAAGITVQLGMATAVTDDQGAFAFQKLGPTRYQLLAKVKPQPDGKDGERLVTTYYPSAIYPEAGRADTSRRVGSFGLRNSIAHGSGTNHSRRGAGTRTGGPCRTPL